MPLVTERPLLLGVPNASTAAPMAVDAIAGAFAPARLLDTHSDPDHGRSVFTLAAAAGDLAAALVSGSRKALDLIDLTGHAGLHPHIGAVDVLPVVYTALEHRGAAQAEALTVAAKLGSELDLPVFLYGDLATAEDRRERADLRRGGVAGLSARILAGELRPDFGPTAVDPGVGATLVTARPPLAAFNLDLDSDDLDLAQRIAAGLRESGGGLPGVRAIGLMLSARGRVQVSTNIHNPVAVPLGDVVAHVRAHATVAEAEIVGLVPEAALEGFPPDVPIRGEARPTIEDALRSV